MLESKRDRNVINDVTMTIPTAGRFLWLCDTTDFHWIAATIQDNLYEKASENVVCQMAVILSALVHANGRLAIC